jgi:hypothetical protein
VGEEQEQNPGNSWWGLDRDSGGGAGSDRMVTQQRGKTESEMGLFTIQTGVVTSAGTWHDEDGDAKAWQDEDEYRNAGNWR